MECPACHNLDLSATTTCTACGQPLPANRFLMAMHRAEQLVHQSRYEEAGRELVKAEAELSLAHFDAPQQSLAEVRLMVVRGRILFFRSQYPAAADLMQHALTILPTSQPFALLRASALSVLGNIAIYHDDSQQAQGYNEQALAAAEQAADPLMLGIVLNSAASIALRRGDSEAAIAIYQRAVAYAEQAGNLSLVSTVAGNLASLYHERGQVRQSLGYALKALQMAEQLGDELRISFSLIILGLIHMGIGDLAESELVFHRALRAAEASDNQRLVAHIYSGLAELALLKGEPARGYELASQVITITAADPQLLSPTYAVQVHCAVASHDLARAERAWQLLQEEQRLRTSLVYDDSYYLLITAEAVLLTARREWDKARASFEQALARSDTFDNPYSQAQTRIIYADALLTNQIGSTAQARELLEQARDRLMSIGATRHLHKVTILLNSLPRL